MRADRYENQLMSCSTYEVHHKTDKDLKTVEMHSHDFCEVYLFLRGSASYIIEDCKYSLLPGDILIIPPGKLHQLDIKDSSATYERFVLWIDQRYLKSISTRYTDLKTCFLRAAELSAFLIRNAALSDRACRLLDSVREETEDSFGADIENETCIKELLVALGQFFLQHSEDSAVIGVSNACVTRAIDYISEHLAEDLSLDRIAAAIFVNKFYFAHVFKEMTNTTPHRYILKKRLVRAKQLLEQGSSAADVYLKCGFSDYTNFFRAFKKEFGITPKQFYAMTRQ